METTFIFPSDNTRFEENGSENTLSNDLELTLFKDFLLRKGASDNTIRIYLLAVRHFSPILIRLTLKTSRPIKHGFWSITVLLL